MSKQATPVSFYTRLESLKKKHATLDQQITKEQKNPNTADFYLKQLKWQKLLVRDQIHGMLEDMRRVSANSS